MDNQLRTGVSTAHTEFGRDLRTLIRVIRRRGVIVLLCAAVGAVVLARRRRGLEEPPDEKLERRYHPARPVFTGTLAEAAGLRPGAGTGEGEVEDRSEREPVPAETNPTSEGGW